MFTLRIPIHSFIDVITNSSTEVYNNAHDKSVEMAKGILAKILNKYALHHSQTVPPHRNYPYSTAM